MYIISLIHKTGFKDLDFFIPNEGIVGKILKIIIFVDKIYDAIQIANTYNQSFLSVSREKSIQTILYIYLRQILPPHQRRGF